MSIRRGVSQVGKDTESRAEWYRDGSSCWHGMPSHAVRNESERRSEAAGTDQASRSRRGQARYVIRLGETGVDMSIDLVWKVSNGHVRGVGWVRHMVSIWCVGLDPGWCVNEANRMGQDCRPGMAGSVTRGGRDWCVGLWIRTVPVRQHMTGVD